MTILRCYFPRTEIYDANICSQKWNDPGFVNKNVAEVLKNMLEQEGLQCLDVGLTYQADHAQPNGNVASSALDHIYCSCHKH